MTNLVQFDPTEAVNMAIAMRNIVHAVRGAVLIEGVDYGKVGNTDKLVLLKPGAERLCSAFKLTPQFIALDAVTDWERNFFYYRYECRLIHRENGEVWGSGIGSCNSRESKYGWRWTSSVPAGIDPNTLQTRNASLTEPDFAITAGETVGRYGKPAEYWRAFRDAIERGDAVKGTKQSSKGKPMDTWTIGGVEYRIPNPDTPDLVNTIDKMAQKRALIAATLIATNASEFFTQDMEDFEPIPTITISKPAEEPQEQVIQSTAPTRRIPETAPAQQQETAQAQRKPLEACRVAELETAQTHAWLKGVMDLYNISSAEALKAIGGSLAKWQGTLGEAEAQIKAKAELDNAHNQNQGQAPANDAEIKVTEPVGKFTIKRDKAGKGYMVAAGITFYSRELWAEAGITFNEFSNIAVGTYDLQEEVEIEYVVENGFKKPVKVVVI